MATSVTVNGAYLQPPGDVVVIDATVGTTHHQAKFLVEDLKKQPASKVLTYVAKHFLTVDANSTVTTVPASIPDMRGTVSV